MPLSGSASSASTPALTHFGFSASASVSFARRMLNSAIIGASDASACRILMSMLYVKSRSARSNSFVLYRVVEEPIQLPIDGVLDLHSFRPRDVKDLVTEYLSACIERGIFQVRIIHGKGIGQLR